MIKDIYFSHLGRCQVLSLFYGMEIPKWAPKFPAPYNRWNNEKEIADVVQYNSKVDWLTLFG